MEGTRSDGKTLGTWQQFSPAFPLRLHDFSCLLLATCLLRSLCRWLFFFSTHSSYCLPHSNHVFIYSNWTLYSLNWGSDWVRCSSLVQPTEDKGAGPTRTNVATTAIFVMRWANTPKQTNKNLLLNSLRQIYVFTRGTLTSLREGESKKERKKRCFFKIRKYIHLDYETTV